MRLEQVSTFLVAVVELAELALTQQTVAEAQVVLAHTMQSREAL